MSLRERLGGLTEKIRPFLPLPGNEAFGPFQKALWKSPLRGPWMAGFLGSALLVLVSICALTGLLSHAAYDPNLKGNAVVGEGGGFNFYFFDWPSSPAWLYAFNQSLHVLSGLAAIPILLAKLWTVIPKLFEWPTLRSPLHGLYRASLALLVGGSLFVMFTGVQNIAYWYPWGFNFVPAHYYAAQIFMAVFILHIGFRIPTAWKALRARGTAPLREDLEHTTPEEPAEDTTAPTDPGRATISRRGMLAMVFGTSAGLVLLAAGQSVGGWFRKTAIFAPRGTAFDGTGPNGFPVNKTFKGSGIKPEQAGPDWRLELMPSGRKVSREELLTMELQTESLPIGCVEGWTTTQSWTGVRLKDLAEMAGMPDAEELYVESLQPSGAFRKVRLTRNKFTNDRALLALKVNDTDLSPDHGFPARIIVPALPGVHNTKWVARLSFNAEETKA